jgi:hypothetical protein
MTYEIFKEYITKEVLPKIHSRQLQFKNDGLIPRARLFLDGHPTRRCWSLWEEAAKLNIDVHVLPAHTSHLLQPLDRCVFACLKQFFFFLFFFSFCKESETSVFPL